MVIYLTSLKVLMPWVVSDVSLLYLMVQCTSVNVMFGHISEVPWGKLLEREMLFRRLQDFEF